MACSLSRRQFTVLIAGEVAALLSADAQTGGPLRGTVKANLVANGQSHELTLDPRVTLLDLAPERLRLAGPKKGCDHGQSGAPAAIANAVYHAPGKRAARPADHA
jgi:xanthine dehydrogenase YagT iron-sulfur-binding subunit